MLRKFFLTIATAALVTWAAPGGAGESPFRDDDNAAETANHAADRGKTSAEVPKKPIDVSPPFPNVTKRADDGAAPPHGVQGDVAEVGGIPLTMAATDSPNSSGSFPTLRHLVEQGAMPVASAAGTCTPAIDCCGGCVPGVFGYVDYLSWKPRQEGLDFATVVNPVPANPTLTPVATLSLDDFGQRGGIRTGIGYRFANGLDLSWNYTHFESADHRLAVNGSPVTGLESTRSFFSSTLMDAVQADDELHVNIHDFEMNFRSCLNDTVGYRIFGGVRWARIDNEFNNYYTFLNTIQGIIHLPTKMDAAGVRLGGELDWHGPAGIKVFGRGAYSLLLADFQLQDRESDTLHGPILDISQDSTRVVSVLEAATGVAWCRGPWELSAGYEFSDWFNMAGLGTTTLTGGNGTVQRFPNLFLDGYFLRLTFMR